MAELADAYRLKIESNEEQIRQLKKFRAEYVSVEKLLQEMPNQLQPKVLVPFGSNCGYFYGYLKHTNEITVHLGDDYFNKMTAPQARELAKKRIKELDGEIDGLLGHKKQLEESLGIASQLFEKNSEEIIEPYDEAAEREWLAKHKENVRREREAARRERERFAALKGDDDPLTRLLNMKDDSEEDEEENEENKSNSSRRNSAEKRVKWNAEISQQSIPLSSVRRSNAENKTIKFRHSSMTSEKRDEIDGDIQSPADITTNKTSPVSKPKSILKKTSLFQSKDANGSVSSSSTKPAPTSAPISTAVSNQVVERTTTVSLTEANSSTVRSRPVSKFKSSRLQ